MCGVGAQLRQLAAWGLNNSPLFSPEKEEAHDANWHECRKGKKALERAPTKSGNREFSFERKDDWDKEQDR